MNTNQPISSRALTLWIVAALAVIGALWWKSDWDMRQSAKALDQASERAKITIEKIRKATEK